MLHSKNKSSTEPNKTNTQKTNTQETIRTYFKEAFTLDLKAGFITAVVALPLAIAFAIASGVTPIMGLYTAVIAGILGSSFGGSKFSITGPTGAMTVIILATVSKFGIEGLLLAGFLAGIIQLIFGIAKLGKLVKYIPFPVIAGFTAGIGAIIFIGQIASALGIKIASHEHIWETISEIVTRINETQIIAVAITLGTILMLIFLPRYIAKIPGIRYIPASFFALILTTCLAAFLTLNIPLVGDIPSGLPTFQWININFDLAKAVLPAAFTIALLGAIEALLCAVVADSMTNTKHNSNKELIGQGITNVVLPFFGAIPATAAIARTAVNIREGAKTKLAGVYHAIILLLIILFLVPVAKFIPRAFLAGVLMFVSARMINIQEFKTVMKVNKSEMAVLLATFLLTIFTDLVFAVEVGMLLAIFLLFMRLTESSKISQIEDYAPNERVNRLINTDKRLLNLISIYTLHGPFFFGAMGVFEKKVQEQVDVSKKYTILRMKQVPFIDATALVELSNFIRLRQKRGKIVIISGAQKEVRETILRNHECAQYLSRDNFFESTTDAINYVKGQEGIDTKLLDNK